MSFHFHIGSSVTDISYAFLSQFFSNIWCPKSSCCKLRLRPAALGSSRAGGVAGVHHLLHGSAPLSLFPGWFFRPAARLTGAPPLGPLSLFLAPAARPLRHLHGGIAAWRREKGRMKQEKKKGWDDGTQRKNRLITLQKKKGNTILQCPCNTSHVLAVVITVNYA